MGGNAMRRIGTEFAPPANFVPITEKETKSSVSALIIPFSSGQIAKITGCDKETTRAWREEKRAPHSPNLINLAGAIPPVRQWLIDRTGGIPTRDNTSLDDVILALHNIGARNTDEGARARQLLAVNYSLGAAPDHAAETVGRLAMQTIDRKMRGEA